MIRRLLPLAGVIVALIAPAQHASAADGALQYTGYTWADTPGPGEQCGAGTFQDLNLSFDENPVPGCPSDGFYLEITGALYSPGPATTYTVLSDDGIRVTIDGVLRINNWWDRGCSGFTHALELSEGWHQLSVEFYENGGGTCLEVFQDQGNGPQPIPANYLAGSATVPETTTTTIAPTSTIATTTSAPEPETTTTTYQPTESSTSPTTVATIDTSNQTSPATPSTQPEIPATVASTSEPTTTAIPTTTSSTSTIPQKITETMSNAEAVAVVTDAAAVAELTPDQAAEVFAAIDESAVTPELAAAIIEAVQDAPPSIRKQFEDKVNIFAGVYDGYVPLGSLVPVGTRRVIIITTGLLVAMPSTRKR